VKWEVNEPKPLISYEKTLLCAPQHAALVGSPAVSCGTTWKLPGNHENSDSSCASVIWACARSGLNIKPSHERDNMAVEISLIASTRGVGVLPANSVVKSVGE
jgi:hypothetical protein